MSRVIVLCALVAAFIAVVEVEGSLLQLPEEVYSRMSGVWNVEALSACAAPATGTVVIGNETSSIEWQSGGPTVTIDTTAAKDGSVLSLDGIHALLSSSPVGRAQYRVCSTQSNTLPTPGRPVYGSRMASTHLQEYAGVLLLQGESSSCDATDRRDIILRAVGSAVALESTQDWRKKEAIQQLEVVIDTRLLSAGGCGDKDISSAGADNSGRRQKRRRGGLPHGDGEGQDASVSKGFVSLRFTRASPPMKSFLERYSSSLGFVGIFILYRIVYSYFSNRASKG